MDALRRQVGFAGMVFQVHHNDDVVEGVAAQPTSEMPVTSAARNSSSEKFPSMTEVPGSAVTHKQDANYNCGGQRPLRAMIGPLIFLQNSEIPPRR
jgi:hypothetical protein